MKNKMQHYLKEILFFVIILILLTNAMSLYKSQNLLHKPLAIQSFQLINNKEYTLPKDKPILVHFWATWCPTCKVEASNINFLAKHFEVLTIAVKSGDDQAIQKYMSENNYNFAVVNDQNGTLSSLFRISAFPTSFIYDRKKKLLFSDVGYTSTLSLYLKMWLANL